MLNDCRCHPLVSSIVLQIQTHPASYLSHTTNQINQPRNSRDKLLKNRKRFPPAALRFLEEPVTRFSTETYVRTLPVRYVLWSLPLILQKASKLSVTWSADAYLFFMSACCCKKHSAVDRHSLRVYKLIKHVQVNAKLHRPRICGNKKQFQSISTENCCRLYA